MTVDPHIHFREARSEDIPGMQEVRNLVKENILSDPRLITEKDYRDFLARRGKGWVGIMEGQIAGFAVADLIDHNVWALFVHPEYDRRGIGRGLHDRMLNWYFEQTEIPIWLSTEPGTRAEAFYRKAGWQETGMTSGGEIRLEMEKEIWIRKAK